MAPLIIIAVAGLLGWAILAAARRRGSGPSSSGGVGGGDTDTFFADPDRYDHGHGSHDSGGHTAEATPAGETAVMVAEAAETDYWVGINRDRLSYFASRSPIRKMINLAPLPLPSDG
jgi:hypothetical protein